MTQSTLFPFDYKNYTSKGNVRNYKVDICNRDNVSSFIEKWHYSKNVNGLTTDYCFKLTDVDGVLIGAIIYGKISMADVWKKYCDNENDIIELKRLCCIDNTPKNTESYFISKTIKWLKKHTKIKKIISYADLTHGHTGVVYKASNFQYIGETMPGKVIMYKNKTYHDKSIRTKYNGKLKKFAMGLIKNLENGSAYYIETKPKNIYIFIL